MKSKYNVLIIGAGNIGAFYDEPDSDKILTHAHAFKKHPGFELLGFVDTNIKKSITAAKIWDTKYFYNVEQVFNQQKVDIACICVPDDFHFVLLKKLLYLPVKFIFLEKPIAKTIVEANKIIRINNITRVPVAVNYSRRFVPEFQKIKENIEKNIYGCYLTGIGTYGKGLIHNGSHLIDLLSYFKFNIKRIKVIKRLADFYKNDKSVSAALTFENDRQFFLQIVNCRKYTIFEIDLLFEKKRIRIINSGYLIEEYNVRQDNSFKDYRILAKKKEINTSLENSLYFAADNIYRHLTNGEALKCNLEDSYNALKTCIRIRDIRN